MDNIVERLSTHAVTDSAHQLRDLVGNGDNGFFISNEYFELKTRIHDKLLDLMDLSLIDTLDQHLFGLEIRRLVERILSEEEQQNIP